MSDSRFENVWNSFERRPMRTRQLIDRGFVAVCVATAVVSVAVLIVLLGSIVVRGASRLSWSFLVNPPSANTLEAGIQPALFGTIWVTLGCGLCTLPLGVATAVLLEEFKPKRRRLRTLHGFIQLNISNLAGVPSVVYGILGLTAFCSMFGLLGSERRPAFEVGVRYFDQYVTEGRKLVLVPAAGRDVDPKPLTNGLAAFAPNGQGVALHVIGPRDKLPTDKAERARTLRSDAEAGRVSRKTWYHVQLPFGRGVLTGSLTLMLVSLPIVIIATQEALRAVPASLREAALGLGATPWQVVWNVTLPASVPGIMTGSILAMSRAIGEAAPLLIIAGIVYITSPPQHLMDDFTVMPLQIFNWAQRPQAEFYSLAAAGIIVLLSVMMAFNAAAVIVRQKLQKPLS